MSLSPTLSALQPLVAWHLRSHVVSRRNALVASTALAERRRERLEVEEYMVGYLARRTAAELSA